MKKYCTLSLILIFLLLSSNSFTVTSLENQNHNLKSNSIWDADIFLISDADPYYAILGSAIACYYTHDNQSILKPMIITSNNTLNFQQHLFIDHYNHSNNIYYMGDSQNIINDTYNMVGSPIDISLQLLDEYRNCSQVLILPYGDTSKYNRAITAAPIASYYHIPIIFYHKNDEDIRKKLDSLNIEKLIIVGDQTISFKNNLEITELSTIDEIQEFILSIIKQRFNEINYIALTNPKDIEDIDGVSSKITFKNFNLQATQIILFGKTHTLQGNSEKIISFTIPEGMYLLKLNANVINNNELFFSEFIEPFLLLKIKDPKGDVISYSQSSSYQVGKLYTDTIICNLSGEYFIHLDGYNGIKGGFFSVRGLSNVDFDIDLTINLTQIITPHFPRIKSLSILAPYLASSHGGIVVSNETFSIFSEGYKKAGNGYATGPWYEENLHGINNEKVNITIAFLKHNFQLMENQHLLFSYLNGPAWLGILGDTNMIPMYYYAPSQMGIVEKGLPSDNPYYINDLLSVGRIIGYNVSDVSLLLCRTLFYKDLCQLNNSSNNGLNRFHFMFGEGFGETGGIFHQIPYAHEIEQYGFESTVFGTFKNSRTYVELFSVFTNANYNEYLGHGDWFWFTPSIYGFDMYSKVIDVAHVKEWIFQNPSIFLTSACLMGRVDGIPPWMNIGITLIKAGCNGFIGATRETGQEAGLEILENHLIIDDYSMGEALRGEKQVDKELPTYYVRTLYGDPAFNPYEPNNGFSNQGRPK